MARLRNVAVALLGLIALASSQSIVSSSSSLVASCIHPRPPDPAAATCACTMHQSLAPSLAAHPSKLLTPQGHLSLQNGITSLSFRGAPFSFQETSDADEAGAVYPFECVSAIEDRCAELVCRATTQVSVLQALSLRGQHRTREASDVLLTLMILPLSSCAVPGQLRGDARADRSVGRCGRPELGQPGYGRWDGRLRVDGWRPALVCR